MVFKCEAAAAGDAVHNGVWLLVSAKWRKNLQNLCRPARGVEDGARVAPPYARSDGWQHRLLHLPAR